MEYPVFIWWYIAPIFFIIHFIAVAIMMHLAKKWGHFD